MAEKKKNFRIIPLIGGLLTLYMTFMSVIPLSLIFLTDISLDILQMGDIKLFLWGIIDSGSIMTNFSSINLENIVPFILWILSLLSGIFGIIGSSYDAKPKYMKKLVRFAAFFLILNIIYYIVLFIFWSFIPGSAIRINLGLYFLIIIAIIFIISARKFTDYQEIND